MAPLQFAEVVFTKKNKIKIVPIAYIRVNKNDISPIKPKNDIDFDPNQIYQTRWYFCGNDGIKCEEEHTHEYSTCKSQIYHLGASYDEVKKKSDSEVKRKRLKNRKIMNSSDSSDRVKKPLKKKTSKAPLVKSVITKQARVILSKFTKSQFLADRKKLNVCTEDTQIAPTTTNLEFEWFCCEHCSFKSTSKLYLVHHMKSHSQLLSAEYSHTLQSPMSCSFTYQTDSLEGNDLGQIPQRPCSTPRPVSTINNKQHSSSLNDIINSDSDEDGILPIVKPTNVLDADTSEDEAANERNLDYYDDSRDTNARRNLLPSLSTEEQSERSENLKFDYGYGEETVVKITNNKYCDKIKEYKPLILKDLLKRREVRSVTPVGVSHRLFERIDGKIYLGCGIFYDEKAWDEIVFPQRKRLFYRDIAIILWKKNISNRTLLYPKKFNKVPGETIIPVTTARFNYFLRIICRCLKVKKVPKTAFKKHLKEPTKVWTETASKKMRKRIDQYYQNLTAQSA